EDGNWRFAFEFNDRGRGPKLTSTITLDSDGIPIRVESSGVNYLKAPVSEKLEVSGGAAHWKNSSEDGEKAFSPKAFYLSLSGAPEEAALLARALLRAPGGKLPLLPDGQAAIEKGRDLVV